MRSREEDVTGENGDFYNGQSVDCWALAELMTENMRWQPDPNVHSQVVSVW